MASNYGTHVLDGTKTWWVGNHLAPFRACWLIYSRAFGDGPRNFEPWSSDVDDTCELVPPILTTTPHQREDISAVDRFNVHRYPTRRVFGGTGLELVTRRVASLLSDSVAITHASESSKWLPIPPTVKCVLSSLFFNARNLKATITPRLSTSSVKRLANQKLHLGRDEVSDWLDARR
ncbi:hypothetical protein TNCV_3663701 [Trichonephila clavipes]|nr:hypothetical protein TNCV_3663701 [Trichonephila clavipes]